MKQSKMFDALQLWQPCAKLSTSHGKYIILHKLFQWWVFVILPSCPCCLPVSTFQSCQQQGTKTSITQRGFELFDKFNNHRDNCSLETNSISDNMSHPKILQRLKATRFMYRMVWSISNLTGTSTALLLRQISRQYDDSNCQSCSFETPHDLMIRYFSGYWRMVPWSPHVSMSGNNTPLYTTQCSPW